MLEMMQKGTKAEDLAKMRREQLDPIRREISRLEGELAGIHNGSHPKVLLQEILRDASTRPKVADGCRRWV